MQPFGGSCTLQTLHKAHPDSTRVLVAAIFSRGSLGTLSCLSPDR